MKQTTHLLIMILLVMATSNLYALTNQGHYRWRNDDGSETTATWAAAEDTEITSDKGANIRLRIEVYNVNAGSGGNINLRYSTSNDPSLGTWTMIDTLPGLFELSLTDNFINNDFTTDQLTNSVVGETEYSDEESDGDNGECIESEPQNNCLLDVGHSTEFEYCIKPTSSAVQGTKYYFAVFDVHDPLEGYSTLPGLTVTVEGSLPVTLSSFSSTTSSKGVSLNWSTSAEIENQGFIIDRIQHSEAGSHKNWQEIASFTSNKALEGQGSTTKTTDYTFSDTQVEDGMTYSYRLSDIDYKGTRVDHDEMIQKITFVTPNQTAQPGVFELKGLFPNPFNPSTTLSYNLSETTDLNVGIYNMQGVLVWQHTYENHPAGDNYGLSWNGHNLSGKAVTSGIYLVNIRAGEQNLTQKVTLLR